MELGTEGYSPAVIRLAVRKAQAFSSFTLASADLRDSLDVSLSSRHIERLAIRMGTEWAERRDQDVQKYRQRQLPRDYPHTAPTVAAVMVDSGRVQTRQEGQPPGVHGPGWKATNVACCLTLQSRTSEQDPQPEPPHKFLDPPQVQRLVAQVHARHSPGPPEASRQRSASPPDPKPRPRKAGRQDPARRQGPKKLVRTTLATMQDWEQFGWQVAAETHRRGLDLAKRKAFVGDGQPCNWTLYEMHFSPSGFVPILDVLHLLGYLHGAAKAAVGPAPESLWPRYQHYLRLAWSGQTQILLKELRSASQRLGPPPAQALETDPRQVMAEALRYVEHNQSRMDYPAYRKLGLPISSAPVESVIKQYNLRIKGSEKFWLPEAVEAMVQIRGAYLSEDGRAEKYWDRPRPYRHAAGAGRLHAADG